MRTKSEKNNDNISLFSLALSNDELFLDDRPNLGLFILKISESLSFVFTEIQLTKDEEIKFHNV